MHIVIWDAQHVEKHMPGRQMSYSSSGAYDIASPLIARSCCMLGHATSLRCVCDKKRHIRMAQAVKPLEITFTQKLPRRPKAEWEPLLVPTFQNVTHIPALNSQEIERCCSAPACETCRTSSVCMSAIVCARLTGFMLRCPLIPHVHLCLL